MARAFDGLLARLPAGVAFQVVLVSEPGRSRRLAEWAAAPDGHAPLLHAMAGARLAALTTSTPTSVARARARRHPDAPVLATRGARRRGMASARALGPRPVGGRRRGPRVARHGGRARDLPGPGREPVPRRGDRAAAARRRGAPGRRVAAPQPGLPRAAAPVPRRLGAPHPGHPDGPRVPARRVDDVRAEPPARGADPLPPHAARGDVAGPGDAPARGRRQRRPPRPPGDALVHGGRPRPRPGARRRLAQAQADARLPAAPHAPRRHGRRDDAHQGGDRPAPRSGLRRREARVPGRRLPGLPRAAGPDRRADRAGPGVLRAGRDAPLPGAPHHAAVLAPVPAARLRPGASSTTPSADGGSSARTWPTCCPSTAASPGRAARRSSSSRAGASW